MVRREQGTKLDEKSRIPLGWVFVMLSCSGTALILAVTVGVYSGRIEHTANAASSDIAMLRASENERDAVLRVIDERLSRIEGAVGAARGRALTIPHFDTRRGP